MFCPKCGNEIVEGAKFCGKCGAPLDFPKTDNIDQEALIETTREYVSSGGKKTVNPILIAISVFAVASVILGLICFMIFHNRNAKKDPLALAEYEPVETTVEETTGADADEAVAYEEDDGTDETGQTDIPGDEEDNSGPVYEHLPVEEYDVLQEVDVESEVLNIREIYKTIQDESGGYRITEYDWGTVYDGDQYKKAIIHSGYFEKEWERWFFFNNDQLVFAFYFSGNNEQRFYFCKNRLFRWKDNDEIHDKEYSFSGWYEWEDTILTETSYISDGRADAIPMRDLTGLTASSTLVTEGYDYGVYNLIDGDKTTTWTEGVVGYGSNECVTYKFDKEFVFHGISIKNGYQKSEELYYKNGRVNVLRIVDGKGEEHYINVPDTEDRNNIDFDKPFSSDVVTVYIDSYFEGSRYEDTCMSELWFY